MRRLLKIELSWAFSRALTKFGIAIAASNPMMATTIMISTSVKPALLFVLICITLLSVFLFRGVNNAEGGLVLLLLSFVHGLPSATALLEFSNRDAKVDFLKISTISTDQTGGVVRPRDRVIPSRTGELHAQHAPLERVLFSRLMNVAWHCFFQPGDALQRSELPSSRPMSRITPTLSHKWLEIVHWAGDPSTSARILESSAGGTTSGQRVMTTPSH